MHAHVHDCVICMLTQLIDGFSHRAWSETVPVSHFQTPSCISSNRCTEAVGIEVPSLPVARE